MNNIPGMTYCHQHSCYHFNDDVKDCTKAWRWDMRLVPPLPKHAVLDGGTRPPIISHATHTRFNNFKEGGKNMPKKKEEGEYIEVQGTPVTQIDVGDTIEGKFVGMRQGNFGDQPQIETDEETIALPSDTVLLTKFGQIQPNTEVKIERLEDKQSTKNPKWRYKDYSVKAKR